ncbi:MAG: hypothetical protein PHO02_00280 [Candidatus Nanoarchaeia archaeon]|nr:hypothetical protein [Candidatus Nanoarchaeia archaeon]
MAGKSLEYEIEFAKDILLGFNDDKEKKEIFRKAVKYWRKAVKEDPTGRNNYCLPGLELSQPPYKPLRIRVPKEHE